MDTKTCFKCGIAQPRSDFYKHPAMADGLLGKCRECTKKDVRERYEITRPARSLYESKRARDPVRRAKKIGYHREYVKRNPVKTRSRAATYAAVKSGKIAKLPCVHCGNPKSQAHHTDYSKPLEVVWCCFKCHREIEHGQKVVSSY